MVISACESEVKEMKLYQEFEDALKEVAANAREEAGFEERFIMMVKNYMNGMEDMSNIDDLIRDMMVLGENDEN